METNYRGKATATTTETKEDETVKNVKINLTNGTMTIDRDAFTFDGENWIENEKEENNMDTIESITAEILKWFEENENDFSEVIEELDSWNGYLGDDRWYSMDELGELYSGTDPVELLNRAYFGHDCDDWVTDAHGEKHYNSFNPNRDYFSFNGYGNLISSNWKDYSDHLDSYFVKAVAENRSHLNLNPEVDEMFDRLEDAEA